MPFRWLASFVGVCIFILSVLTLAIKCKIDCLLYKVEKLEKQVKLVNKTLKEQDELSIMRVLDNQEKYDTMPSHSPKK